MFHGTITKELTSHEEWSHYNENIIEDQKDFVFVKYNGLHLKSMENLQSCISLRVCIFSNNFITDIQPLQSCIKLIKLDLHGNQIKTLPDRNFWGGLKNLKLLYLHDNGFAKLKNICVLAACASLIGLTMFDCPVSLKKGYRHVLVNSIWPLKALDHHVISDEEIIQNWHLPERFKTFNHRLFFNLSPALIKGTTYEDEINTIKHVISRINGILAHNSPVLIVQRWIRGFIVRKHLRPYFTRKRPPQKIIKVLETKWICVDGRHEDKFLEDIFLFKPESNTKGKVAHWKQVSIIRYVDMLIIYSTRVVVSYTCGPTSLVNSLNALSIMGRASPLGSQCPCVNRGCDSCPLLKSDGSGWATMTVLKTSVPHPNPITISYSDKCTPP